MVSVHGVTEYVDNNPKYVLYDRVFCNATYKWSDYVTIYFKKYDP